MSVDEITVFAAKIENMDGMFSSSTKSDVYEHLADIVKKRKDVAPHLVVYALNGQLSGHSQLLDAILNKAPKSINSEHITKFSAAINKMDGMYSTLTKGECYEQLNEILKKRKDLAAHFVRPAINAQLSGRSILLDTLLSKAPKAITAQYVVAFAEKTSEMDGMYSTLTKGECYEQLGTILKKRPDLSEELLIPSLNAQLSGHGEMLDQVIKRASGVFTANHIQRFSAAINEMDGMYSTLTKAECYEQLNEILKKRKDLANAVQPPPNNKYGLYM